MIIEELHVVGFGKWRDAAFRFSPGLNLICAPNEAGKTTLLQGLFAALYGMKRDYVRTARYLPEHEKYAPWHPGPYETIVQYRLAGKSYRLHRRLEKEREQAWLYLNPDWEEVTHLYQEDRRKERNFLELHLGLNRSLFLDVTWVKREPLAASEYLLPSLFRSDETDPAVNRMLAELERDIAAIGKKERAENTLLGKAASLVSQAKQKLEEAEQGWKTAQQLTRRMMEWEAEQDHWQKEQTNVRRRLEQLDQAERLWQEKWTDSYRLKHSAELTEWESRAKTEEERKLHRSTRLALDDWGRQSGSEDGDPVEQERMDRLERLERLETVYQQGWQLIKERESIREQIHQLIAGRAQSVSRRHARGPMTSRSQSTTRHKLNRVGMAASSLLAVTAVVLFTVGQTAGGLVAAGLAAGVLGFTLFFPRPQADLSVPGEAELRRLQEREIELEQKLQSLLAEWSVFDWESFVTMRDELMKNGHRVMEMRLMQEKRRQEEIEQLIARWGDAVRRILQQEKAALDQEREALSELQREAAVGIQRCREQIARAMGEIGQHDEASVANARSEYDDALASLQELQRRREALELARDTLQEAMAEWNRDLSPTVNRLASEIMARITDAKYQDVRLDPRQQFSLRVLEPAGQQIVEHEQLSTGTQDQLYFAQRVALLRHVSNETEPLPLFLDDHFVHYDEERLGRTLDYVMELSGVHQVFLFSCQQRELDYLEPFVAHSNRHKILSLFSGQRV